MELSDLGRRSNSECPVLPADFQSKLFNGFTSSALKTCLGAARQRKICENQVLQHEGEPAGHLSLLISGLAAYYKITPKGEKLFLRWITPGDVFGLAALQRDIQPYLTTIHGLATGWCLVWDRGTVQSLADQMPRLRENAFAIAADYTAHILDVLVVRTSQAAQQRLAQMLIETARQIGNEGRNGVELSVTNERLAEMAGVSLFTVSRHLSDWHRQGILTKRRGRILLRNASRLTALFS